MASQKSAKYPHQWADGSWHSVPQTTGPAKGVARPGVLPPPPVGTYDPSIDYNAGASGRGWQNAQDDAATGYDQAQEDFKTASQHISDLIGQENQDYGTRTADLGHQYGILGHQQAEHAAQQGILSQGLLGQSNAIRATNQAHDQTGLDTAHGRALQGLADDQQQLALTNARQWGGYNNNGFTDPITGQPIVGSLVTQLGRTGIENNAFLNSSAQERAFGAAQGGYVPPAPTPGKIPKGLLGGKLQAKTPVWSAWGHSR